MVESILRAAGYRTGLFTSPHLCDVRERIRLDGYVYFAVHRLAQTTNYRMVCRATSRAELLKSPYFAWERRQLISKQLFTEHFWWVYNRLESRADGDYTTAAYFRFMTLLGASGGSAQTACVVAVLICFRCIDLAFQPAEV